MNEEDFLESTNIEFTYFDDKKERILKQYPDFEALSKHLQDELIHNSNKIIFNGKNEML